MQSRTFPRQAPKEPQSEYSMPAVNSNLYYDMDTFPRGLLTIINEKEFGDSSRYRTKPRSGSDEDAEKLTELFLDLGFYVDRHDNLSKSEINEKLKSVADEDFSKLSCYACIILSHGDEGIVHASDGDMKIRDLTSLFRTKKLEGKPKLFFFQACQGSNYMHPLEEQDGIDKNEDALPNEADFLFCHSTVQGYSSFRNPAMGSWYMQTLVKVFRENADKMDIMQMLARVNFLLAENKSTNGYIVRLAHLLVK